MHDVMQLRAGSACPLLHLTALQTSHHASQSSYHLRRIICTLLYRLYLECIIRHISFCRETPHVCSAVSGIDQAGIGSEICLATDQASSLCCVQNGQWNKVSFIKKLLDTTDPTDAEWILYMEADTIIDAPGFTLPFEFYSGKDIVLLGNPAKIRAGDPKGTQFFTTSEKDVLEQCNINQVSNIAINYQSIRFNIACMVHLLTHCFHIHLYGPCLQGSTALCILHCILLCSGLKTQAQPMLPRAVIG